MRLWLASPADDRAAELLAAVGDDATAAGATVLGFDSEERRPDDVCLFVPCAGGVPGPPPGVDPRRAVALCTDFPGSDRFDAATALAALAGGALGLFETAVLEQRRRGVSAQRFRLGLSSRWRAPNPGLASSRERQVLFVGSYLRRRERLLSSNATSLAALRADIRLGSPLPGSVPPPAGAARRQLFGSSAIVLDIHPRRPYGLDRALALEAIGAGALPVFEHCVETGELRPGTHLATADGSQLGDVASELLREPARLDLMAAEAGDFARAELSPVPAVELLIELAERVARRARRHESWRIWRRGGAAADAARAPSPAGVATPPSRDLSPSRHAAVRKRARLAAIERHGRARAHVLGRQGRSRELRCVFESDAWAGPPRGVAICVPVYDDGHLAVEALESAVAAAGVSVEIVVADDASGDGSLALVEGWLRRRPDLPIRLLASAVNRGVGAVRNDMMAQASAPLVFMLDADNQLFPDGLAKLVAALDRAPAATFAYGLLQRVCDGGAAGLLSAGPWDPDRLREGNYIDAMALLRREHVLEIGGFTTDRRLYGWEDYDLWCRIADGSGEAVFVPEFVGRYRARSGSMLSVAEIDNRDAIALLRERAPRLRPSIPAVGGAVR